MVENLFCVYFTVELAIRFAAFRYKRNCMKDSWFVFDSVLVALMASWLHPFQGSRSTINLRGALLAVRLAAAC